MTAYEIALGELGTKEVPGPGDHPRIVEYHRFTRLQAQHDAVAWCAAFVNFCLATSHGFTAEKWLQLRYPGTGQANARSLLDYGQPTGCEVGAIAVFWRDDPNSWKGHVGFVAAPDDGLGSVLVVGGNQSNAVCIKPYPRARVLGFRKA